MHKLLSFQSNEYSQYQVQLSFAKGWTTPLGKGPALGPKMYTWLDRQMWTRRHILQRENLKFSVCTGTVLFPKISEETVFRNALRSKLLVPYLAFPIATDRVSSATGRSSLESKNSCRTCFCDVQVLA